ncbi:MAG TPA: type II toxin-antitoxin system VapC family toxin [Thermoanaerobaculia bacterium]|jgi:predicted nucleic acid-binding protein|nr:type II toxin-antitoxin system VapC family toxin [Thermoanaerobaculia bacterium]
MKVAVIDASLAVKAVLPNPLRDSCRRILASLLRDRFELLAPALWIYETTSAVAKAIYQEDLTPDEGRRTLAQLQRLGVRICSPGSTEPGQALEWTLYLRRSAAYDSFYLALAESQQCELWTADKRLFNSTSLHHPWVRAVLNPEAPEERIEL